MEQNYYHLCDNQFDAKFDKIELLERYPWVGINYDNSNCRVLILGDSHYATEEDGRFSQEEYDNFKYNKDSTRGIIRNVIGDFNRGEPTWKMHDGLLKTFITTSPENVKEFWSKVAFYNFIQEPMKSCDEKPQNGQIENGWRCLVDVANVIHPTFIVMFGIRNWFGMEQLGIGELEWENRIVNRCKPAIGKIYCHDANIPLAIIKHSARYYSPSIWHDYLQEKAPEVMSFFVSEN